MVGDGPASGNVAAVVSNGRYCLNCGVALIGDYCHICGQNAHVHRSIGAIWHEIAHGAFHFEGRIWRTLPMLAWRPGVLTRRYVAGERARYVSPTALFLFSIFAIFTSLSILGIAPPAEVTTSTQVGAALEDAKVDLLNARKAAVEQRERLAPSDPGRAEPQAKIDELDENLRQLESTDGIVTFDPKKNSFSTGWHRLDHGLEKAQKNPGLMLYKLQANSYKFSWLLIPLSLPFMWLLFFWKRGVHLYDHAVFVTYSLAAMSMLFVIIMIAGALGMSSMWLGTAATTVALWHINRQLKEAYRLRWWSAMIRTIVLIAFIAVILMLFTLALVALGLLG